MNDETSARVGARRFYHGTRAHLEPGDLIQPGYSSNYTERRSPWVYFSESLDAATWGAELAKGEGPGRIYLVQPTGSFVDGPNLTDKKFPGNPTKSYRSQEPLRVVSEVLNWEGHSPEVIQAMKDSIAGLEPIDERMNTANARFAITSWDEKPYSEGEDRPKLTRASVTKTYTGDIDGEGQVEYLMMYRGDGSAAFVGLELVTARIGGKTGTFVLQRAGVFESGLAKESYSIVPGSATAELQGLVGDGSSAVGHGMEHPFSLSYELV